jgi:hypothetical protein
LADVSQRSNRKLRDIAADLVYTGELPDCATQDQCHRAADQCQWAGRRNPNGHRHESSFGLREAKRFGGVHRRLARRVKLMQTSVVLARVAGHHQTYLDASLPSLASGEPGRCVLCGGACTPDSVRNA